MGDALCERRGAGGLHARHLDRLDLRLGPERPHRHPVRVDRELARVGESAEILTTITALGGRGEGVAEIDGRRVFVPFALPGDVAEIEAEGERGTLLVLAEPGPDRIEPFCPYFGTCGGCLLQHVGPDTYEGFKHELVVSALRHANIDIDVAPLVDARGTGRRRATLHATSTAAGYMRARSHDLLNIATCPILVPALREMAPIAARNIGALIGDCDVLVTATATGLDVAVKTTKRMKPEKLVPVAQRLKLARLALNGETIFQARPPTTVMGKAHVELPVASFLQATEAAELALSRLVLEGLGQPKAVADLFSGCGPFALRIAETARVGAFDSDKPAIAALQRAVRFTQGLKPVTATSRDLFRDPLAPIELEPFDAVVFDPPRAGAEAQSKELALSKVKTVVAVSCDPRTFARDAAILIGGGYRLESVTPVDQFAWSPHVEVVGVFRR
jgi:23S rRNA (uracil1939-C5)-methyltransferase